MVSPEEGVLLSITIALFITLIGVVVYVLHKKNRKRIHDAETRMKKGKGYTQDLIFDGTSTVTSDAHIMRNKRKKRRRRHKRQKAVPISSSTEIGDDGMSISSVNVKHKNIVNSETVGLESVTLENLVCRETSKTRREPISVKDKNKLEHFSSRSIKPYEAAAAPLSLVWSHAVSHSTVPQCKASLDKSADYLEEMTLEEKITPREEIKEAEINSLESPQNKSPVTEDCHSSPHSQEHYSALEGTDSPKEMKQRENEDKHRENEDKTNQTENEKLPRDICDQRRIYKTTFRDRIEEWRRNFRKTESKIQAPMHIVMSSICHKYSVDPVLMKYLTGPPKLVGMETSRISRRKIAHAECRLFRIWRDRCSEKTMREELLKQRIASISGRKNSGSPIKEKANATSGQSHILTRKPKRKLHVAQEYSNKACSNSKKTKNKGESNTKLYDKRDEIVRTNLQRIKQADTVVYPQVHRYQKKKKRMPPVSRNMMTCPSLHTRWNPVRYRIRPPWL